LSDYFYWKDNNHPFANLLENSLVNFNDYFVENMHSKIRAQTNKFSSPNSIIEEACIIDSSKRSPFIEAFSKNKKYPYTPTTLDYLTKKTSCFLIDYFSNIYKNLNASQPYYKKQKLEKYKLATLDKIVDLKSLPTGYHTAHPPKNNLCDHCDEAFDDGCILICGHSYHYSCYEDLEKKCDHCLEFYKKGVSLNVKSFINRLEKGSENIEFDDLENNGDGNEINEEDEDYSIRINQDINRLFINAKNDIKNW